MNTLTLVLLSIQIEINRYRSVKSKYAFARDAATIKLAALNAAYELLSHL